MRYFWLSGLLALLGGACTPPSERSATAPVRIRWEHDPENLDPLALPTQHATEAANLLHLGLLQVDSQTQQYAPALAEALPRISLLGDSLTQLDFQLRPAATWDNGHPVLATDVAFTLKLMLCPGLPNEAVRVQLDFIRDIALDPADPHHFTLVCDGQAPEYAWVTGDFSMLPEDALDPTHSLRSYSLAALQTNPALISNPDVLALARRYRQADLAHHPERLPGCGPYRLATWLPNSSLTFQRKPNWWADRLPAAPPVLRARPQQLQFSIVPDEVSAALALRRHEVDVYPQVSARSFQRLQASAAARQELAFYTSNSYELVTIGFNTQLPLLHDKLTRQALSCLLNPTALLAATQLGQGRRTVGLLSPASPFYNDSLPLLTYSPSRAVALLRQAGWQQAGAGWQRPLGAASPPQQLKLTVRYRADDPAFATIALQLRTSAATLGIAIELQPTEPALLTATLQAGDFELYVRTLKGNPFGYNFMPILHSRGIGGSNFTRFSSPATDRLLDAIAATGPAARKRQLLRRFQVVLQDEVPLVPLFFLPYRLVADRHLGHLLPSGIRPGYDATTIIWDGAPSTPAR